MKWVDAVTSQILSQLETSIGLVEDVDGLLQINELQKLNDEGIHVLRVSSPLTLRYEYDHQIRESFSQYLTKDCSRHDPKSYLFINEFSSNLIPFDIQLNSKHIKFSLSTFFPNLNYTILRKIPVSWRSDLFQVPQPSKLLSEEDTVHFIIEHNLGLDSSDLINSPVDAFMFLADMALRGVELPTALAPYLVTSSSKERILLVTLVERLNTPKQYLSFFTNLWNLFVQIQSQNTDFYQVAETSENIELNLFIDVLVKDDGCQNQMTRLLLDDVIKPTKLSPDVKPPKWMRKNVHYYIDEKVAQKNQLSAIENTIPNKSSSFEDWGAFTIEWAKFNVSLSKQTNPSDVFLNQVSNTQSEIDLNFLDWLSTRYTGLLQRPYLPKPTMVHHVLPYLSARYNPLVDNSMAVLVVDGMAYEDWLIIQQNWDESGI